MALGKDVVGEEVVGGSDDLALGREVGLNVIITADVLVVVVTVPVSTQLPTNIHPPKVS